jgi:hypothetical protein
MTRLGHARGRRLRSSASLRAQPGAAGSWESTWSDALPGARAFIRRYSWTFANVRDAEGTVGSAYRLTGLPTTFVIDANGCICTILRGPRNEHSLQVALAGAERS